MSSCFVLILMLTNTFLNWNIRHISSILEPLPGTEVTYHYLHCNPICFGPHKLIMDSAQLHGVLLSFMGIYQPVKFSVCTHTHNWSTHKFNCSPLQCHLVTKVPLHREIWGKGWAEEKCQCNNTMTLLCPLLLLCSIPLVPYIHWIVSWPILWLDSSD